MKTFRLFSMAALALMMAACSNNDDNEILQNTQQPGTMHFTATIAAPSGDATTRTVYTEEGTTINVKWKVGDEIALCHNSKKDVVTVKTVNDDGSATIDGTIDATGTDGEDVQLVYPASVVTAVSGSTPTSVLDFLSQDGTREYIAANLDHRVGHGQLAISGGNASLKAQVTMQGDKAIWKLSLTDGTNPLSATAVTLKVGTTTIAQAASEAKSVYYLCVVPAMMGSGDFTIEATDGSDTYTYTKAGGISLAEGKYYQSTVKMAPTVTLTTGQIGNISHGNQKTIGDITIALSGDAYFHATSLMDVSGDAGPDPDPEQVYAVGSFTFTTSVGKIKRIDINHDFGKWWGAGEGWPGSYDVYDKSTFTWSGTPAASVTLNGSQKGTDRCALMDVTSIVFTLEK